MLLSTHGRSSPLHLKCYCVTVVAAAWDSTPLRNNDQDFLSLLDIYVNRSGASFSKRRGFWLILVTSLLLGDPDGHSLTNWSSLPQKHTYIHIDIHTYIHTYTHLTPFLLGAPHYIASGRTALKSPRVLLLFCEHIRCSDTCLLSRYLTMSCHNIKILHHISFTHTYECCMFQFSFRPCLCSLLIHSDVTKIPDLRHLPSFTRATTVIKRLFIGPNSNCDILYIGQNENIFFFA
jgi:hypothetical protein